MKELERMRRELEATRARLAKILEEQRKATKQTEEFIAQLKREEAAVAKQIVKMRKGGN